MPCKPDTTGVGKQVFFGRLSITPLTKTTMSNFSYNREHWVHPNKGTKRPTGFCYIKAIASLWAF
jgi:hypothetical protein